MWKIYIPNEPYISVPFPAEICCGDPELEEHANRLFFEYPAIYRLTSRFTQVMTNFIYSGEFDLVSLTMRDALLSWIDARQRREGNPLTAFTQTLVASGSSNCQLMITDRQKEKTWSLLSPEPLSSWIFGRQDLEVAPTAIPESFFIDKILPVNLKTICSSR